MRIFWVLLTFQYLAFPSIGFAEWVLSKGQNPPAAIIQPSFLLGGSENGCDKLGFSTKKEIPLIFGQVKGFGYGYIFVPVGSHKVRVSLKNKGNESWYDYRSQLNPISFYEFINRPSESNYKYHVELNLLTQILHVTLMEKKSGKGLNHQNCTIKFKYKSPDDLLRLTSIEENPNKIWIDQQGGSVWKYKKK